MRTRAKIISLQRLSPNRVQKKIRRENFFWNHFGLSFCNEVFSAQVRMRKLGELRIGASSEYAHLFLRRQYLIAHEIGNCQTDRSRDWKLHVKLIVRTKDNCMEDPQQQT